MITEYIASISYGKDSLAMLEVIKQHGMPLDRIVHVEIMATDTIPADLPPMMEFKAKADRIIKERYGIEVEHLHSRWNFNSRFYSTITSRAKPEYAGRIRGFPLTLGRWCARDLKQAELNKLRSADVIQYVGIASDEPNRFSQLTDKLRSPLVEAGWAEFMCREWCEESDLLSPIYTTSQRGGCWFCPVQPATELRKIRKNYPEYWEMMLKWDTDSPVTFHADGHTVHDFDRRFRLEDEGFITTDDKVFRWDMLDAEMNYRLF